MPRSVIFLLAALVSSSSASLLRGLGQRSEILREVKPDSFDCSPYELDGLGEIGVKISSKWICKLESSEAEANQSFTFQGDIKSIMKNNFNADITIPGATKMTIPWDAINNSDSTIMSSHAGITISQDHGHRERHLASTSPFHRVLIVRAVTNGSTIASAEKLKNDFYQDENNLKKRLEACSAGKLKIYPATRAGTNTFAGNHGIITMNLGYMNASDKTYDEIGNVITQKLSQRNDLDYTTRVYIIDDNATWFGAAAWAEVGGTTMWVKSGRSHTPMVQIHEYGHLLGMRHSGDSSTYDDDTCYMGGVLDWTDAGNNMCFNAAKTWYLGWYNQYNKVINVQNQAFKGNLVGIDDASKGNAGNSKVVVKVNSFFIMYNRRKGINSGAKSPANGDKVIITSQTGSNEVSNNEAVIAPGNTWRHSNFQNTGKTLVVTFCRRTGDEANVLVYIDGVNNQQCDSYGSGNNGSGNSGNGNNGSGNSGNGNSGNGNSGNGNSGNGNNGNGNSGNGNNQKSTCPSKRAYWSETSNRKFNCAWYRAKSNKRCRLFGNKRGTDGCTANQTCLVCRNLRN